MTRKMVCIKMGGNSEEKSAKSIKSQKSISVKNMTSAERTKNAIAVLEKRLEANKKTVLRLLAADAKLTAVNKDLDQMHAELKKSRAVATTKATAVPSRSILSSSSNSRESYFAPRRQKTSNVSFAPMSPNMAPRSPSQNRLPRVDSETCLTNLASPCASPRPAVSMNGRLSAIERKLTKLDAIEMAVNRLTCALNPQTVPGSRPLPMSVAPSNELYGCREYMSVFEAAVNDMSRALRALTIIDALPMVVYTDKLDTDICDRDDIRRTMSKMNSLIGKLKSTITSYKGVVNGVNQNDDCIICSSSSNSNSGY